MKKKLVDPNETIEESFMRHCLDAIKSENEIQYAVISYTSYATLVSSLGASTQFVEINEGADTFQGITLHIAKGNVIVVPDYQYNDNEVSFFGKPLGISSFYNVLKNNNQIKEL